jgi:hypothetical protein
MHQRRTPRLYKLLLLLSPLLVLVLVLWPTQRLQSRPALRTTHGTSW